jgi:hypothetical protein
MSDDPPKRPDWLFDVGLSEERITRDHGNEIRDYIEWLEHQRDTYKFIAKSHENMLDIIQQKLDRMVQDYELIR